MQETQFSSGCGVVVNFGKHDYTLEDGRVVKGRDYVRFRRTETAREYEAPLGRNVFTK